MTSTHAVFVPDADFFGTATFAYTVCDPGALCADSTVTLTLDPVADAPRANDDDYSVTGGNVLTVPAPGILANDFEPDGEQLTVNGGLTIGFTGILNVNNDGSFTYIPALLFTGQDTGTYTVCDPTSLCTTATITITVSPAPPTTESLYLTSASPGSGGFALNTSVPAVANPEPDAPGGDSDPGLDSTTVRPAAWRGPINSRRRRLPPGPSRSISSAPSRTSRPSKSVNCQSPAVHL